MSFRMPGFIAAIKFRHAQVVIFATIAAIATGVVILANQGLRAPTKAPVAAVEPSSQPKRAQRYVPTPEQWDRLMVEPARARIFRSEHTTEGKISIDEDRTTPVFSPYPGRVTKLLAKPGDTVKLGQPLFLIEAADMVQAQNDFLTSIAALNKARSKLELTEIIERQNRTLYDSRAVSLRDFQQAQSELSQARSDLRSAEAAIEGARNRLVILGKTNDEIADFQKSGRISPETPIYAPISGTVVQRKIGPGQYVSYTSIGSIDPVFTIGDLSTVWLLAYVRESEAPKVRIGQQLDFSVPAYPDQVFKANVVYVSAALDSNTRRLMIRATIENADGRFKPEMFASIVIFTEEGDSAPAVSRDAVIFEADSARVWVVNEDKSVELRQIKTGVVSGKMIQVLQGLQPGEKVITKGGLFVDRAAGS